MLIHGGESVIEIKDVIPEHTQKQLYSSDTYHTVLTMPRCGGIIWMRM